MTVAKIDEPLAAFRMHANQKTSAKNASILELLDRIAPYLTSSDRRISPELRQQILLHSRMTRRIIESAALSPEQRLISLLSLAGDEPGLLKSPTLLAAHATQRQASLLETKRCVIAAIGAIDMICAVFQFRTLA